jgi:hypothetical protein
MANRYINRKIDDELPKVKIVPLYAIGGLGILPAKT